MNWCTKVFTLVATLSLGLKFGLGARVSQICIFLVIVARSRFARLLGDLSFANKTTRLKPVSGQLDYLNYFK